MRIRRLQASEFVNVLSLLILMSFFFLPLMAPYFRVITFYSVYFVWLFSCFCIDRKKVLASRRTWFFLSFILLADLLLFVFNSDSSYLRKFITTVFISYNWGWAYVFYRDKKYLFSITIPWVFVMLFWGSITTFMGCKQYPMASRILATSAGKYDESLVALFKKIGIGGYDFIYSLVFLIPSILCLIKTKRQLFLKFLMSIVLGVSFITILQSGYSTGILCMLIAFSCTVVILTSKSRNTYPVIGFLSIGFMVIWFMRSYIFDFVGAIGDSVGAYYVSTRMSQLSLALSGEGVESLDRVQLYLNAVRKFIASPIFGAIMRDGDLGLNSGHSEVLNYLEVYGICGISYVFFIINSFRESWKQVSNQKIRLILVFNHMLILFFALINRIDSANGLCMIALFVAPIIFEIIDENIQESNFKVE